MELAVPADRLRSRDLPLVCAKTGSLADHAARVVAGGEEFLIPVSRAAVRRERAARRLELAAYSGGVTAVALVTMALVLVDSRPSGGLVALLLLAALCSGATATVHRRRTGLRARRDGDTVVLDGVAPRFADALQEQPAAR